MKNDLNRIHDTPGNGLRKTAFVFPVVTSLPCHASCNDCALKLSECPGKELQELEAQLNFHGKCALGVSFFRPIISQSTSLFVYRLCQRFLKCPLISDFCQGANIYKHIKIALHGKRRGLLQPFI